MSTNYQFPRSTPESQGVSSAALLRLVNRLDHEIDEMHSLMLLRHGAVVAEGWWTPYAPQTPHLLWSLSKSFCSTGVGLAVAEGRLSVDDQVLSFFPEDAPAQVSENLAKMRVRDLLTMSTGHHQDTTDRVVGSTDGKWVRAFLSLPVEHEPGTFFVYNTAATYVLSAIVQKVTGQMLIDYLRPRLFEPLGIEHPTWQVSPEGINTGGFGLSVVTEDIARFGQLYLQKGIWKDDEGEQRILPEAWVDAAGSKQVSNGSSPESDWEQGYGYQFWRCQHNFYRGDGAFGQYCIVMPEQDAVLAITSSVPDMQTVLNIIWEELLPGLKSAPLPEDKIDEPALREKLAGLALEPPAGYDESPLAEQLEGIRFCLEPNQMQAEAVEFSPAENRITFVDTRGGLHPVTYGRQSWLAGETDLLTPEPLCLMTSAVWTAEDVLTITLRLIETPAIYTLVCCFQGKRLTIETHIKGMFGPTELAPLFGRVE